MMLLRLLNPQGIAGLAASIILALLLANAKIDARHWHKQSAEFEALYRGEVTARAETIANVRVATEQAQRDDAAHAAQVEAAQTHISERTLHDLQARLADARARAASLQSRGVRLGSEIGAGTPSGRPGAPMSGLSQTAGRTHQAAGEDRLPNADQLTATEQAIQLDELIKWVKAQAGLDPGAFNRDGSK